jgi:predicted glycosyltransferase
MFTINSLQKNKAGAERFFILISEGGGVVYNSSSLASRALRARTLLSHLEAELIL